jgi:hypothetical protein
MKKELQDAQDTDCIFIIFINTTNALLHCETRVETEVNTVKSKEI